MHGYYSSPGGLGRVGSDQETPWGGEREDQSNDKGEEGSEAEGLTWGSRVRMDEGGRLEER